MTAEIGVMNRTAVALATDSAVSKGEAGKKKIYNSADKLFQLSEHQPIGVMIYGAADFIDIPWETVIKKYRQQLQDKSFKKLEDYARNFFLFLERDRLLFPEEQQKNYFQGELSEFYHLFINDEIKSRMNKFIEKSLDNSSPKNQKFPNIIDKASEISKEVIDEILKHLKSSKTFEGLSKKHIAETIKAYRELLDELSKKNSKELRLTTAYGRKLNNIFELLIYKDFLIYQKTIGIVFAGFGTDEPYPEIACYHLGPLLHNKLRHRKIEEKSFKMDFESYPSMIIPFAQTEDIESFFYGAHPSYTDVIFDSFKELLNKIPQEIIQYLGNDTNSGKRKKIEKIEKYLAGIYNEVQDTIHSFQRDYFIFPLIDAIKMSPKNELAEIAEALVNLSSLKKKYSTQEDETVGGPTDVAVISKGDGFVWIKRKHYFQPELNPRFIAKYN